MPGNSFDEGWEKFLFRTSRNLRDEDSAPTGAVGKPPRDFFLGPRIQIWFAADRIGPNWSITWFRNGSACPQIVKIIVIIIESRFPRGGV
jgi:hypothetical protein